MPAFYGPQPPTENRRSRAPDHMRDTRRPTGNAERRSCFGAGHKTASRIPPLALNLQYGPGFTVAVMEIAQVTGTLTVGQLAARAEVRIDTIRYYEREGLLHPPPRTQGEHRRYGSADLDRLLFIRGAKRLGLRLAEIRELLAVRDTGTCACDPAEALLRRHVTEIGAEIERLSALRTELLAMLTAMPGPDCPDPLPGTWCAPRPDAEERR